MSMTFGPWLSSWNYDFFRVLFKIIPHGGFADEYCKVLLSTPLLSTCLFAACSFRFWTKNDEQQALRRHFLINAVFGFGIACVITLILRPWIHWSAPVLNPDFQTLFPRDFWGIGSDNCFPSHSTLAYFMIAAGFWPLNRRLSLCLSGLALLLVSFPRVYVGGHYPIDVLFSCGLAILILIAMWRWPRLANFLDWLGLHRLPGGVKDLIFFIWIFELGEGFHSLEQLASLARHSLS
jgi:membrane-associated phospholipid phosphatase